MYVLYLQQFSLRLARDRECKYIFEGVCMYIRGVCIYHPPIFGLRLQLVAGTVVD
jgi:hypothetical protein